MTPRPAPRSPTTAVPARRCRVERLRARGGGRASRRREAPTRPADRAPSRTCPLRTAGTLTIGTDSPAYEPWFVDDDPTNGKGYESAVAYAVAEELGFAEDEVDVGEVPFNNSYKPGAEGLRLRHQPDLDHARSGPEVVDFSDGYYSAAQAVIALKGTAGAERHQPRRPRRAASSAPRPAPRR